jgi:tetratricopeptide (TPR) repeat protein
MSDEAPNEQASAEAETDSAFLRAEIAATQDRSRQSRLLGEAGEIAERNGDEPIAARDYLAAFNADPTFREPLEALVRLLERRRSLKNLGRVIDALVRAAQSPSEKARALVMRAAYAEDVQDDIEVAKGSALEALSAAKEAEVEIPEHASVAMTVELIAARANDDALREEGLVERTNGAGDPQWKALLLLDIAQMAAKRGEIDRALAIYSEARALGSRSTFAAAAAAERLVKADPGLPGSEEANARSDAYADALEAEAALVGEALADPERASALGVPRWALHRAFLVDAYLRAADARRMRGEIGRAANLLDRAIDAVPEPPPVTEEAPTETRMEADRLLRDAVISARMRIAELLGDTAHAATLAEARLAHESDGPTAAALAMRIAEQAAAEGDAGRALEAVNRAVKHDPGCVPARALQLDILADSGDSAGYSEQLESLCDAFPTDEARGRAFLLSSFVNAARVGDPSAAKAALSQSTLYGVPQQTAARVARTLALVAGDATWQDEATRRVIASGAAEGGELPQLWFELARLRLARNDVEGAKKAINELSNMPESAWLGRALEAFLPGLSAADPTAALRELAKHETDGDAARALEIVSALRAVQAGDTDGARGVLRDVAAAERDDLIVSTFLSELELGAGDPTAAAIVIEQTAAATNDPLASAALWIQAGLLRWRVGDKPAAMDAFSSAAEKIPASEDGRPTVAQTLLGWASRGVEPDTIESRRKAIALAKDAGGDDRVLGIERFVTEIVGGDGGAAAEALATVEEKAHGDLAVAAALGRLLWADGMADREAFRAAMDRLREAGSAALAASERYRALRDADPSEATLAAREWFDVGGGAPAALEWLLCATKAGDVANEADAREAFSRALGGDAGEAIRAWGGLLRGLHGDSPVVSGTTDASRLAAIELAQPGSDPRRRAAALCTVGKSLGEETHAQAMGVGAWSLLVMGDVEGALNAFAAVAQGNPDDLAAWEGMRTAAEAMEAHEAHARAAEELGTRCGDAARGAAFWEEAANVWLALGQEDAAEAAFTAAFERDPRRTGAFDKLFRRVRERKDGDRLLELIAVRLENTDDPPEVAKLYWEQARVLREKGDAEGALNALENVTMIEPDHVGALALTGEIFLKRQMYAEAADRLSRLASLDAAPPKNRVTAGVASADIFENKLDQTQRAVDVLAMLHRSGLSTLPVRERLAKSAARAGAWEEAVSILEQLMKERAERDGRIDAARLAMTIHRDKIGNKSRAAAAVTKLLEDLPGDGEAIDMLLAVETNGKRAMLERARDHVLSGLQKNPNDPDAARRLVRIAGALGDAALEGASAAVSVAIGGSDAAVEGALGRARARSGRVMPQWALTGEHLRALCAPQDDGPISQLFAIIAPAVGEALGPTLAALGVGKRDRVDARAGLQTRGDIAAWAGAFGISEFELYVGGRDPVGVQGVAGEVPSIVIGPNIRPPFDPMTVSRVVRELFALARGTTLMRTRDDTTVAAVTVAACRIAEVPINTPPYAILGEVEKALRSAMPRKIKKAIPEVCAAVAQSGVDPRTYARAALASQSRVSAVACGEVGIVLVDMTPPANAADPRAVDLAKFVLSPTFIQLRRALGVEPGGTP